MKKKVCFSTWASRGGENLLLGESFGECLLVALRKIAEIGCEKEIEMLLEAVENSERHPIDALFDIFMNSANISYTLAKQLRRLDIVNGNCFSFKNDIEQENALLRIIEYLDIRFVLYSKEWSKNNVWLTFEVADWEMVDKAINNISLGRYMDGDA